LGSTTTLKEMIKVEEKNNECDTCMGRESPEQIKKWLDAVGFYVHFIIGEPFNYHTHGLEQSFDHLDLQIAFPLPREVAMPIINTLVGLIKSGQEIKDGMILFNIIRDYCVKAYKTIEDGRSVIRILLPDVRGMFPDDIRCDDAYKIQMYDEMDY